MTNKPLIKYGWTRTKIKVVLPGGGVGFEGGSLDGLSSMSDAFEGARVGEEWLVKVTRCPPWAFGEIEEARRVGAQG